ncbi:MAG TPA: DUF2085 domain-containing protein [Polyangiaceae bacterium]|nr:DUF2085 domain-containing protein [Polyangiaceae bacterium]
MKAAGGWLRLAALACLALLPLLPVLSQLLPPLTPLERAGLVWFDLHCHRDPARTLHLLGVPLAVCARCSGIYFGLGVGALLRPPHLSPRTLRLWVALAAALMIADVALETYALHQPWPLLRLTTGALLGYPVGSALGNTLLVNSRQPARLTTDN